jgi:hypothetical protein
VKNLTDTLKILGTWKFFKEEVLAALRKHNGIKINKEERNLYVYSFS